MGLRLFEYCIGFAATVVISRWLGPEGRGLFCLAITTASVIAMLCNLSLGQANTYLFGSEGRTIEELAGQSGLIAACAGSIGIVAMITAACLLPRLFNGIPLSLVVLTALTIPIMLHRLFVANLLTLTGRAKRQFIANFTGGAVQIGALIGLWGLGAIRLSTALLVNLLYVAATWAFTALIDERRRFVRLRFDTELLKGTFRQMLPLHVSTVVLFLHLRVDMFMVKWFGGNAALGLYSLAVPFAESILIVSDSLAIALSPKQVQRDIQSGALRSLQAVRICLLMSVSAALIWAACGRVIITTFVGRGFISAYKPLVALLPGLICLGVQRLCGVPIVLSGRPWTLALINVISLSCNIALNLSMIPRFGPVGAALASGITYSLGAIMILFWTASLAEVSLPSALVPVAADFAALWHAAVRAKYTALSAVAQ